jgi:ribonuclease Y
VVNIIEAHHEEKEAKYVEALIVAAADAISASRSGARKESLENYLKRLKDMENLVNEFKGIEKCFAIQAGREIRIMVDANVVDDPKGKNLARDIALKIEKELKYPGQIKITLIRESRFLEYAR